MTATKAAGMTVTKATLDWIVHEAKSKADVERWYEAGCPQLPDPPKELPTVPLAVDKATAGLLLGGMSVDWIEKYVLPHVDTVKPSRAVLIPVSELQRWLDENSDRAL
jgi:hypothetical protein